MSVEIIYVSTTTGSNLFGRARRVSDGYWWDATAGAWAAAPLAADRKIALTEGAGVNLYRYSASVSGMGDAGLIETTYHDDDDANDKTIASSYAYVQAGDEIVESANVYDADIRLTIDGLNDQDEYTVGWFRNGVRITSGITVPKIQVVKRADGTDLIPATAMTEIGSSHAWKYDESSNRVTRGEAIAAVATATIDGATRSCLAVLTRDS